MSATFEELWVKACPAEVIGNVVGRMATATLLRHCAERAVFDPLLVDHAGKMSTVNLDLDAEILVDRPDRGHVPSRWR